MSAVATPARALTPNRLLLIGAVLAAATLGMTWVSTRSIDGAPATLRGGQLTTRALVAVAVAAAVAATRCRHRRRLATTAAVALVGALGLAASYIRRAVSDRGIDLGDTLERPVLFVGALAVTAFLLARCAPDAR